MDIFELLKMARERDASDLQLIVDSPPLIRTYGVLEPVEGMPALTPEYVDDSLAKITTQEERDKFNEDMEIDFAYSLPGVGRLRCNAAQQLYGVSLAIRLLPLVIPTIDELELPQVYKDLIQIPRGLIVVSGPTDSGKSTSMASMIDHLNHLGGLHVVTIEDPIEYVHKTIKCAVTQRQLGKHTHSFAQALKHILRQNPDVILVGEMRDLDTAAAVLNVAETGHLVLSTSHAPSAPQAIERMVDLFPPHERYLAQMRLSSLLVAVICQTLVPRTDGSGRIAAVEILMANQPAKSLIREGKLYQLPSVIRTHHSSGMVSRDDSLIDLYDRKIITRDTMFSYCSDRHEVESIVGKEPENKRGKSK